MFKSFIVFLFLRCNFGVNFDIHLNQKKLQMGILQKFKKIFDKLKQALKDEIFIDKNAV